MHTEVILTICHIMLVYMLPDMWRHVMNQIIILISLLILLDLLKILHTKIHEHEPNTTYSLHAKFQIQVFCSYWDIRAE